MSRREKKKLIWMGIGCVTVLIAAVLYSIWWNDGRWVKEMNLSEYVFSIKDLPMLGAGVLIGAYAIYFIVLSLKAAFQRPADDKRYTRKIPAVFGLFGLFGFLGFSGFWTYAKNGSIFPFIFFAFFGFFGFFFEGKLSHTLQDEMLMENRRKAELKAYKIGFTLLFIVMWLMGMGMFSRNVEWCAIFMLISISLICALILFLSNYLLYRYEKEE